jgi:hypothetical protein
MNFTPSTIAAIVVAILAVSYLIIVIKRSSEFPFVKALNPFYTKEMLAADNLKKSLQPIITEIETKQVANFIKFWSDKFEKNRLTIEDVESLNAKIDNGEKNQVDGILAVHPDGRKMFNQINAELKAKQEAIAAKALAEQETVTAV